MTEVREAEAQSAVPQTDVRVTKYLSKPNAETTKYFTHETYDIDELERKVNENTADISNIESRLYNDEADIYHIEQDVSVNTSDITNLQASIASVATQVSNIPINPYEGLIKPLYINNENIPLEYNYNRGKMIFWEISEEQWSLFNIY